MAELEAGNDIVSVSEMKGEAVARMLSLNLSMRRVLEFDIANKLYCSDNNKIVLVPENILKEIHEYQDEFKSLVYHVVHTHIYGMETYECLTVSPYEDDWEYERPNEKGWTMSHSINITHPENTESGSIQLINKNGILLRIN